MFRNTLRSSIARSVGGSCLRKALPTVYATPNIWRSKAIQPVNVTRSYALSTQGEEIEDKIDNISASEYGRIADEYLENMSDELEELSMDHEGIEIELVQGVLTVTVPPNGTYVINRQPANKQIWLSSPISGPNRFDSIQSKWIALKDGSSLTEIMENEISEAIQSPFKFESIEM